MIEKHVVRDHEDAGSKPAFPTNFRSRLRAVFDAWHPELALLFIILWMVAFGIARKLWP